MILYAGSAGISPKMRKEDQKTDSEVNIYIPDVYIHSNEFHQVLGILRVCLHLSLFYSLHNVGRMTYPSCKIVPEIDGHPRR